ncbi:unnamed protein product [Calypogeia fissa]
MMSMGWVMLGRQWTREGVTVMVSRGNNDEHGMGDAGETVDKGADSGRQTGNGVDDKEKMTIRKIWSPARPPIASTTSALYYRLS